MTVLKSAVTCLTAVLLLSGCPEYPSSRPGVVQTSEGNPLASVGAGQVEIGGNAFFARYVIDSRAHLCWFNVGDSVAPVDCCALQRVEEARPFLKWLDASACPSSPSVAPPSQAHEASPASTSAAPPTAGPTSSSTTQH